MKTFLSIFLLGIFLLYSNLSYSGQGVNDSGSTQPGNDAIKIVSSPEMESLTSAWVSGYKQKNAGQNFIVNADAGDTNAGSIYVFTSNSRLAGVEGMKEKIVVGHEIIVPVMNANNPFWEKIGSKGITETDLSMLLTAKPGSESFLEMTGNSPVRVYIPGNGLLDSRLADFCNLDASLISATRAANEQELIGSVRKDIGAIGFCRLSDVLNAERNGFAEGIRIVPIDKNLNGQIDGFENIYSSPQELVRGAWIGKYPRKLCSNIYVATGSLSQDEASIGFLTWVINEGQAPLTALGFSNLSSREKTAALAVLRPSPASDFTAPGGFVPTNWMIWIAAAAFLFLVYIVVRAIHRRKPGIRSEDIEMTAALNTNSIQAPAGLFYDKTHTWAFMEQDGFVKVGIDDFLQHVTGKLSQIKMKAPGEMIRKGEKIVTIIHEGKQLEIYSPVTGYIKTQNKSLLNNPSQINTDPYFTGWIYQVDPSNWLRETKFMFMAGKFRDWLDDEFVRLKDFLAVSANSNAVVYNHIVLQDGGELTDNVLANLEPEVWEDFQTHFIDVSR